LNEFGAVSKEVVEQMALNGSKILGVDVCLSTSGIAGPDGGSLDKPVGLIWIGIAIKGKVFSYRFQFGDNRERNMQMTVFSALNLLRCKLLEISIEKK
jgi:nicotinamide-nucleotide amidase